MKKVFVITLLTIGQLVFGQSDFKFFTDENNTYSIEKISEFINNEVRSKLSREEQERFDVYIVGTTSSKIQDTVILTMETKSLYIEKFDGEKIPSNVSKYTDDDVILSLETFQEAFNNSTKFDNLKLKEKQDVLKTFAFFIAESARFEDIDNAVNNIVNSGCEFHWKDYMLLVRRWKTLSIFANDIGEIAKDAIFGGWKAFLIAPISEENVIEYDKKVKKGWLVVRRYGSQTTDVPVNVPDEGKCLGSK